MLDEGLAAGLRHLGFDSRCILYAEREAYPCAVLEARMQEGSLAAAPLWCGDFRQLPARELRGVVDCIAAGFPCQDLSLAGRRAGLDGSRSGLFFDILDIADACGARLLFLENVAGIASATASVVDEAEGALDERAAARVLGELAERGWDAEWLTLSASDVGASHGRARWFCFAWRNLGDPDKQLTGRQVSVCDGGQRRNGHQQPSDELGHADGSGDVANPQRTQRRQERARVAGAVERHDARGRQADGGSGSADAVLGHAGLQHINLQQREDGAEPARTEKFLADPGSPRCQGPELRTSHDHHRGGQETHGPASQLCSPHAAGLFAPGPADGRWSSIISHHPHLAPALEPTFRKLVNGLAFDMDDCRAQRLKCVGNGVVALCAAAAVVVLVQRSGMKP